MTGRSDANAESSTALAPVSPWRSELSSMPTDESTIGTAEYVERAASPVTVDAADDDEDDDEMNPLS